MSGPAEPFAHPPPDLRRVLPDATGEHDGFRAFQSGEVRAHTFLDAVTEQVERQLGRGVTAPL